jgi:hypothetical protein
MKLSELGFNAADNLDMPFAELVEMGESIGISIVDAIQFIMQNSHGGMYHDGMGYG